MCHDCVFAWRLLAARFGAATADYLLWNHTAYPIADGATVLAQARRIIEAADTFDEAAAVARIEAVAA